MLGLVVAACGGRPDEPSEPPAQWSVESLSIIRPEAIGGQEPFGRVSDIEIDDHGSVFVLDGLARTVRVFDHDGVEIRTFGGRGQGPGEIERPTHLLWGPDGNLWVVDWGIRRLTAFDPEGGELVATYASRDLPIVFPFALQFAARDTLRWVGITSPDLSRPEAAWVESHLADGAISRTDQVELPFVEWPLLFEHRSENAVFVLPVPFSTEPLFGFDPSARLWYTHSADTLLHRFTTRGEIDLTVGRGMSPSRVTSADRQHAVAGSDVEELREARGQAGVAELTRMIPDTRPYLDGFFFDDDDNIWVVHAPDGVDGAERTIDVYDESGAFVAVVHARLEADPRPRARGGFLAAVVRDELGVESVVLYTIDTRAR